MISLPRFFTRYYMCACVCMCVHVCACVCMCVHVCVCEPTWVWNMPSLQYIYVQWLALLQMHKLRICRLPHVEWNAPGLYRTVVYTYAYDSHLNYICMATLRRCVDGRPAISIRCIHVALCLGVQEPEGIQPALLSRKVHRSSAWGIILHILMHKSQRFIMMAKNGSP